MTRCMYCGSGLVVKVKLPNGVFWYHCKTCGWVSSFMKRRL